MDREQRKAKVAEIRGREVRRVPVSDLEMREVNGELHFDGWASVTDRSYQVGFFTETIQRGAFKKTLSEKPDTVFLISHDGLPLARTVSGTLNLDEDDRGLHVDAMLDPSDPDVQRIRPKVARGDVSEMSFAFRATRSDWDEEFENRLVTECDINRGDVSIVGFGANPATSFSLRDANDLLSKLDPGELESFLRSLKVEPPKPESGDPKLVSLMDLLRAADPEQLAEARTLLLPPPPAVDPPKGLPLDVAQGIAFSIKARSAA